jgi:hypothetical protein
MSEPTYQTYHDTLAQALDAAYAYGVALGAEFDSQEANYWLAGFDGGVKYGETRRAALPVFKWKGKLSYNRALTTVVYRMESGRYELTCYIN